MTIWELSGAKGLASGWLDSLHLNFSFVKTDLISKFLVIYFTRILPFEQFASMVQSFKKLNIEMNFESGAYLSEFPKVKQIKDHLAMPSGGADMAKLLTSCGTEKVLIF